MIRSIRRRHKLVWIVLAVLLPIIFIAALAFRHIEPVNGELPDIKAAGKK